MNASTDCLRPKTQSAKASLWGRIIRLQSALQNPRAEMMTEWAGVSEDCPAADVVPSLDSCWEWFGLKQLFSLLGLCFFPSFGP